MSTMSDGCSDNYENQYSVNTVKRHLQNIMEKTGYDSGLELAMNAKSLGLVVNEQERTKNSYGS